MYLTLQQIKFPSQGPKTEVPNSDVLPALKVIAFTAPVVIWLQVHLVSAGEAENRDVGARPGKKANKLQGQARVQDIA